MKPAPFTFNRPGDVVAALAVLRQSDSGAVFMAGGQSLGPLMNLRLARPSTVIGIAHLRALQVIEETESKIKIGAAVTHATLEDGIVPDPIPGIFPSVAGGIAYRAVRNKGTIGGSIAHADPAADWITVLTALNATIHAGNVDTNRIIAMHDVMQGAYTTRLLPDELILQIDVPKYSQAARWGYAKLCRKAGEFADAMACVVADPEKRYCRVVLGATGGRPVLLHDTAQQLARTATAPARSDLLTSLRSSIPTADATQQHQYCYVIMQAIRQIVRS